MSRKHVVIGIVVVVLLATALVLLLPKNKPGEDASSVTQTPEPVIETERPTELVTVRITNPPTVTATAVPPTATPNPWKETEYPPTCEEAGYVVRENTIEGYTVIAEGKPALGHDWTVWTQDNETGRMVSDCSRCGKEISRTKEYVGPIARIDFFGSMEGISKNDRVTLQVDFSSPIEVFSCYAYTSWQGHNTLKYPKKNYTVRLYDDQEITEKHRLIFQSWRKEHKYVLKANYRDFSQARNLVAADLWADMAAVRPMLFETLRNTSHYGAIDGFPVAVTFNGEFIGLYTMNLHIDNDLYEMHDNHDVVMIANSSVPDETRFRATAVFMDEKEAWEVEYCGSDEDSQWAKDALNELITFVMNSDNETFRTCLGEYLDVDAAVDYLIFLYVTGLKENAAKDLVLLKYHDCDAWIPTVYDMEHAFGLSRDGSAYLDADDFLPRVQNGVWDSGTDSLLWDRLLQQFEKKICIRYADLRKTILAEDALISRVDAFVDGIPEMYYAQDLKIWPRDLPEGNPTEQIKAYIKARLRLLDSIFSDEVTHKEAGK